MKLYLHNHNYKYAVEQILLMLFPDQRPEYPEGKPQGDRCESTLREGSVWATATCRLVLEGEPFSGSARVRLSALTGKLERDRLLQKIVKLAFYRAALKSGRPRPVWGALTGIRPGKLVTNALEAGLSEAAAVNRLCTEYDVSRERAQLCLHTAKAGLAMKEKLEIRDVCLYVGIPFCPTRCAYCSFVSHSVEKSMKLIPPFLEALLQEVDETARVARKLGLRPVSVYMGGGTPTTLSPEQLDILCTRLEERFDLSSVREYTVEAGRPDTITMEKLAVLRKHGVDRVSVNPQSMEDAVLEAIGRKHTAQDVLKALDMVRRAGNFAVNMDLIAGLPADTPEGFSRTLDAVLALKPENITVHTLSLKKGSRIMLGQQNAPIPDAREVGLMLDEAQARLRQAGYGPYYLYRQKFMSGGFENVGWSMPGYDNEYNICIMEELCTILAMGGGGSTKLVSPKGRIERIFDPKYPKEYIELLPNTLAAKSRIEVFYQDV